jgi:hypothetical protein
MTNLDELRKIALALPGAEEAPHHNLTAFKVGGKIFATFGERAKPLMVKLDPEDQHNMASAHPAIVVPVPGYWGRKGSTFVDVSAADLDLVARLIELAWRRSAPARYRRP